MKILWKVMATILAMAFLTAPEAAATIAGAIMLIYIWSIKDTNT